jgi:molybdopterin molybdotransferase
VKVDIRRSVDDHLATVLSGIGRVDPIELTLLDAQGLLLAEDVAADHPLPSFDNSAMDGYAVRSVDVRDASAEKPVVLPVVGDVIAGGRSVSGMGPGLSMRIMTGAPIPPAPTRWCLWRTPTVAWPGWASAARCAPGTRCGGPVGHRARQRRPHRRVGDLRVERFALFRHGQRPREHLRRPLRGSRVAGDLFERPVVVDVGKEPGFGQITDANSYLLTAAARDAGAASYRVGIVPDDHERLMDVLESQLLRADVLVTSGGVSMGAYDVVKEALSEVGSVEFIQVAMQPGKPQGFGHLGPNRTPIFCLPGNPVSSLVSFEVFVRPAIRKLLGKRRLERATVEATALERMASSHGTRQFRRGLLHREVDGSYSVSTVGGPGSHLIAAMASANCLIVIDEDVDEVEPGARVPVIPLLLSQR